MADSFLKIEVIKLAFRHLIIKIKTFISAVQMASVLTKDENVNGGRGR